MWYPPVSWFFRTRNLSHISTQPKHHATHVRGTDNPQFPVLTDVFTFCKETSFLLLGAQDRRISAESDQIFCWPTGTASGTCQETKTRMVRACHTPRQPSFRASLRMGDTKVGRGNAKWTMSKSGRFCPCPKTANDGLPQRRPEEVC